MAKAKAKAEKKDYEIIKKRSGRYAVKGKNGKYVNGDAKVAILLAEKLIKPPPKKKAKPAEDKPAE
jgi:hypothetical protein